MGGFFFYQMYYHIPVRICGSCVVLLEAGIFVQIDLFYVIIKT